MTDHLYGLVIAGGSGTRLWPLSRSAMPKQLLPLSGSGHSLLQDAFARLARQISPERILLVTALSHAPTVLRQVRELAPEFPEENLLCEPTGLNSAPAILWAAMRLEFLDPKSLAVVVWGDQVIGREEEFDQGLELAQAAVREEGLAVIGVPATRPETNLGYIRKGALVREGVYRSGEFIEKPDSAKAEALVREGDCLWNPGVFVFHIGTLLEEFEKHAPDMFASFQQKKAHGGAPECLDPEWVAGAYAQCPRDSIDYAILEKTERLLLIPRELEWSDLGAWDELYRRGHKDQDGNVISGQVVTVGTRNSYLRGGKRLITVLGAEGLVVVDTDDALLVCDLKRVQDVKLLVEKLRELGLPQADGGSEIARPWGGFTMLAEGEGYQVKVLRIEPGQRLSLQTHRHRDGHWVVAAGSVRLIRDGEEWDHGTNDYFFVPRGARHRIENTGNTPAKIIEVQQGSYLGEDDIVRIEDDYGRS